MLYFVRFVELTIKSIDSTQLLLCYSVCFCWYLLIFLQRFLQLQYPQNSKESESKGNAIDENFTKHVEKMEAELTFDLNL